MSLKPANFLPLLVVAALAGCGDPTPNLGPRTFHGGTVLPIPDGKGSAEVVKKAVPGEGEQAQLLVYFYGPDNKPLSPSPTSATFKPTGKGAQPVEFKPSGEPDSPLASPPFPDAGEVDGDLSVAIDGKPTTIALKAR